MPRINKGRAARRRKVKARSINEATKALLNGKGLTLPKGTSAGATATTDEPNEFLGLGTPQDRDRSLPGAILRRREESQDYKTKCMEKQTLGDVGVNGWYAREEEMLMAQLGFIPGNGVSVSGRIRDLETRYPHLFQLLQSQSVVRNEFKDDNVAKKSVLMCDLDSPTVLKLYPLAIRDVFVGGKSGGRKFKSRKRGRHEISSGEKDASITEQPVDRDDGDREKASQKSRKLDSTSKDRKGDIPVQDPECGLIHGDIGTDDLNSMTIEPFPTTFWLTHPALRTLVSQLEIGSTDNVMEMEKRLSLSTEDRTTMKNAHHSYANIRKKLVTPSDADFIKKRKWEESIGSERGVAGIRKHETVKCLHAHTAHYLATLNSSGDGKTCENLVGRWAMEAIENMVKAGKILDK